MRFTNIITSAAFAAAIGFSGSASADTIVGGINVTGVDMPKVQELCMQLAEAPTPAVDADQESDQDDSTPENAPPEDSTAEDSTAEDSTSTDTNSSESKTIDDITAQDCVDAGLLPEDTDVPAAN